MDITADTAPDRSAKGDDAPGASTDGRSLRRERNRDAVIVALLDLIRDGSFDPGTSEIAERAGVSHRSVFRYFEDLNDLVRAAIDYEIAEVVPMAALPSSGNGPVADRIESLIDSRFRIFDYTAPVARVARARSLAIPAIDKGLMAIGGLYRGQLAGHFEPELSALDKQGSDDLLDAIQVIVSFESFDVLRRRLDRDNDEIRRAWRSALFALLTS